MGLFTSKSPADITSAVPDGLHFFSLQFFKDQDATIQLVRKAEKYGFKAIVLTVDLPVYVKRFAFMKEPDVWVGLKLDGITLYVLYYHILLA